MNNIFVISGYGIPRDIIKDENYNIYLKMAFNAIFDISAKEKIAPVIIFCGGKTDMLEPYERTEAEEMIRLFDILMNRKQCKEFTGDWKLVAESKSISTLENLIFAKEIIEKENIEFEKINLIFEFTRYSRIKTLAANVFNDEVNCIPFDFSQNAQRYAKVELIQEKENNILKYDMLFIDKKISFEEYHDLYLERLRILRVQPENHDEAVKKLWEKYINL
ncbi:MAG: hypothetical protein US63_C0026G0005 [Candidatus Moranbacteria bacterium GW2011_GWC2_37_8]|nr:MAG: hypothetical protein US63_C0026G0005 [Candidatus Moranbacteria bacterium GW2011_GWC2_37_8]KKQ62888.1 MAG: hypothetical protein US82_C0004G0005 [Parcubacteria group bacterium GW2011_GWC1_38_22]KKQ81482.1 MAG: hypothetical protein UT03_C0001G0022 [Candidatus Moranbacteria bacterium GW2011_GWD2_38_7]